VNLDKDVWEEGFRAGMDMGRLADAIDSEGSILLTKVTRQRNHDRPEYCLRIFITNTCYEYLLALQEICFGSGRIVPHAKKGYKGSSGLTCKKDSYRYYIPAEVFKELLPYLDFVVKKEHKRVAKRFFELTGVGVGHSTTPHTEEEFNELEKLYLEMKELNRR